MAEPLAKLRPSLAASLRRVPRGAVIPGAALTLAVSAIALLALTPTDPASRGDGGAGLGAQLFRVTGSAAPAPGPRGSSEPLAAPAAPPAPRALSLPAGAATGSSGPLAASAAPAGYEREIENASDLLARLRIIDRLLLSENTDEVVGLIEKLLEHTPGAVDEVRSFRVALVSRLGCIAGCERADRRLVTFLEPEAPRNERLAAIEACNRGGVHPLSRPYLARIAQSDRDLEVRKKARWALGLPQD